jgi:hypothetical protein
MSSDKTPRILQQQPQPEHENPAAKEQQMGEGSYEGTRDYNQRQAEYQKTHDVQKDAEAAKPKSDEEARELKQAEEEGKSHSKGEH